MLLFARALTLYGWGVDTFSYFKTAASVPISELSDTVAPYIIEVLCLPGQPGLGDPAKKTVRDVVGLFDYSQDTPGILADPMKSVRRWAALSLAERRAVIPGRVAARESNTLKRIKRGIQRVGEPPSALVIADRREADDGTTSEEDDEDVPSESEGEESNEESEEED